MSRWTLHEGEALAHLRSLPDAFADALVTDPPYSSGGMFRGDRAKGTAEKYCNSADSRESFEGDGKDQRVFMQWCVEWLTEARRVVVPGGVACVFIDWRQLPALTDAVQWSDWTWRGVNVWDKTEGVRPQPGRFRQQTEFVVWATNGAYDPPEGVDILPGAMTESNKAWDRHHQTGKPTAVMRWLCRICPPGGLVLDPFAGSGSTGVGALLEGRRFHGVERSAHYAEVARERLDAASRDVLLRFGADDDAAAQAGLFAGSPHGR